MLLSENFLKKNKCSQPGSFRRVFGIVSAIAVFPLCALAAFAQNDAVAEKKNEATLNLPGIRLPDPFEIEPLRDRFLARSGRVFGKIFLSSNQVEDGEITAAFDLSAWLSRVVRSPKEIPVESEPENPKSLAEMPTGIYIGNTRAAERLGIFAPVGEGETYVIETRGNCIFIVGKTPMATRIAVGEFLREVLGVRFVWPGADGAEWEPLDEIPFPRVRIEHVPAFPWRLIGTRDSDWNVHLGFGELPSFSHNIGNVFNREIYAENPELAPEVLNKKYTDFTGYYAPQPNLKNPVAVEVAANAAKTFFDENPEAPMFALGINDSTNWDESCESQAAYGKLSYFRNLPDRSDYFYDFVNKTADAVREFNGKSIGVIAYMDVQNTPKFPVRKNVVPVLCADRSMWIFPEFKKEDKALIRRWARSGAEIWGVYDYYYGSPFVFPRLFLEEQAEAIKYVHANGGKIFYAECNAVTAFDAPKIWLASQLFRDPAADPKAILDAYYAETFGEAATAMKKFYEYCCGVWKTQGGQSRWIKAWNNENSIEIFPPEKLARARTYLDNAFSALPKPDVAAQLPARERRILARLNEVSRALERAEKFATSYFARKSLAAANAETAAEVLAMLKSPAWRYEEIYSDADYADLSHRADISAYEISDPRPGALKRILDFLNNKAGSAEKIQINRALERVFGKAQRSRINPPERKGPQVSSSSDELSVSDSRLKMIAESVPAFYSPPDFTETFELETFKNYAPGDWRAGKNLFEPKAWNCILAASEKLEMAPTNEVAFSGKTALRIAGEAERVELLRTSRIAPGKKVLVQAQARGIVSCGSVAFIEIDFLDGNRKTLSRAVASLPVGETADWRKLIALGEAPARSRFVELRLYVGLQGPGDVAFFDDLTVTVF